LGLRNHPQVVIVDYEAGNLFSVEHACRTVGLTPLVTSDPGVIGDAEALILPGVGAFGAAMAKLHRLGLVEPLRQFAASGKPFMGICLGMQLLFSRSDEFGCHDGLNLIEGNVVIFPADNSPENRVKVPQIGWNRIFYPPGADGRHLQSPLSNIIHGEFMYFVHSHYARPVHTEDILTVTEYAGITYCSSVMKKNIFATQYHPEKSAKEGLKIYKNWANYIISHGDN